MSTPLPLASPPRIAPAAIALSLAFALGFSPLAARAERADRDKPTQVEADAMHYDDVRQTNVFTGRVTLTRGTLVIRADRILMRQDPDGYQSATATGEPATFRQKRDGGDFYIEGRARELEYDGKAELLRLRDRARLTRLDGTRVTDEVHGGLIVYDARREIFTVDGGGRAVTPDNPGGRVRVVIQPRGEAGAAPSGAGSSGAGAAPGTPATLRPAPGRGRP